MKKENTFYHALKIDDSKCVGCTHCVKKCPTGAVRIKGGKAVINRNWCVDCGECLKSCPVDAIYVEQDDFQNIFNFKNRVVLVPSVFIGQFSKYTTDVDIFDALRELGFKNVYVVKEQELPDGDFPTVSYPNPEAKEAFELGLGLAKEVDADLVLATDPDADRLGVYVKDSKTGEYKELTGNMSGCLLADYEIGQRKELYGLPEDGYLIKTIVTSNMADAIAKSYGVGLIEVLTGFKYIGQQILGFETTGKGHYLFGFEESYGCLIGTHARDKDAIVATMALCEAAAYYKTKGKTLWDAMVDMYEKYGYYKDAIQSITLKGIEGLQKIQEILETLRKNPPMEVGGYKVVKARDYQADTIRDIATGEVTSTGLPSSNVLYYDLTDDAWLCVRPSGTEPKVKFYYGIKGTSLEDADEKSDKLGKEVLAMIDAML